jgi:hypothetical protein
MALFRSEITSYQPGRIILLEEVTMSEATVREILERIDNLPENDRLLLEQRLAEKNEAEWLREALAAREAAARRGIDQETIDHAIEDLRYAPQRD